MMPWPLLQAAVPFQPAGVEAIGLSGMTLFTGKNFSGINHISAYLPQKRSLSFAAQQPYFLSDVQQFDCVMLQPHKNSCLSIYNRYLVAPAYFATAIGTGIAVKPHPKLTAGIQTDFLFESAAGYGNFHTGLFKLCITIMPHSKYSTAWQISLSENDFTSRSQTLSHCFAINYSVNSQMQITGEVQWQNKNFPILKTGIRYQLKQDWLLISGINFKNAQFATGIIKKNKNLSYGIAIRYHQILGAGHSINISYDW